MVRGCVGRGGSGKSLYTVSQLWGLFKKGRDVASNTPLIDLALRRRGLGWDCDNLLTFGRSWGSMYLSELSDLNRLDNCVAFLDELAAWMGSHMHREIPEETRRFLAQDRREGVDLYWTHRTTQVFDQVRHSTAELVRCARYGFLVVGTVSDPEEKEKRLARRYVLVSNLIYQRYDTMAQVGSAKATDATGKRLSADERGYGSGKRVMYRAEDSGFHYKCILPTLTGDRLPVDIRLTPDQAATMIRIWGPESIGLYRERRRVGSSLITRWVRGPEQSPGLIPFDLSPRDWRYQMGFDVEHDENPDYQEITRRMVYSAS